MKKIKNVKISVGEELEKAGGRHHKEGHNRIGYHPKYHTVHHMHNTEL